MFLSVCLSYPLLFFPLLPVLCPHDMSTTTYTTQPQGLALCSRCHPAWDPSGSRQGHPRYTGARTTGRLWVARHQRHKRRSQDAMTHHPSTPKHQSSDKHKMKMIMITLVIGRSRKNWPKSSSPELERISKMSQKIISCS